jgi:RNA polymerase sigma-70 factor, ECF subfamily
MTFRVARSTACGIGSRPAMPSAQPAATNEEIELVGAIRDGDERAFTSAVEQHHGRMVAVARAFVLAPDTATEVVHDAWSAALGALDQFDGRTRLRTWLLRFVVMLAAPLAPAPDGGSPDAATPAVDPVRFRGAREAFPGHWRAYPRDWRALPQDVLRDEGTRHVVEAAVAALPVEERAIIAVRDIAGCPAHEACHVLDLPDAVARERLHQARCQVRAALERHFDG